MIAAVPDRERQRQRKEFAESRGEEPKENGNMPNGLQLGTRRGYAIRANEIEHAYQPDRKFVAALEEQNVLFRALASIMYNCVPTSGHPGGSISSSRFVEIGRAHV